MGWVNVQEDAGRTLITADLNRGELERATWQLRGAVTSLLAGGAPPRESSGVAPAVRTSAQPAPATVQQRPDAVAQGAKPAAPLFDPQALMLERLQSGLKKTSSGTQPSLARATSKERSRWREISRTEPEDHNNEAVTAAAYAPLIDGLPGGDGHGGWLVSASRSLLNLWECGVGRDEPALQLMHSQAVDVKIADLVLERKTKLLAAAARKPSGTMSECVALHSLDPEAGMFAPRANLLLPPASHAEPVQRQQPSPSSQALQVESLHSIEGPLLGCVAASFKNFVTIYPTIGSTSVTIPKTTWQAHRALVSQVHCSAYSIALFTAAVDGTVSRWDMKAKPKAPSAQLAGLPGAVTGLHQTSDRHALASSADGMVAVWDLRRPDEPMRLIPSPDDSAVVRLAASPEERLAAFATAHSRIFAVSLEAEAGNAFGVEEVSPRPLAARVSTLVWNTRKQLLVAAAGPVLATYAAGS